MKQTEYNILNLFKDNPNNEFSTSKIVKSVFPEEFEKVKTSLSDNISSKENIKQAKKLKAQLHRRVLYYLNKLIDEGIIELRREGAKGEKFFALGVKDGERFVIDKYKRRIIIEKPIMPAVPIEGYEQKGYVLRHSPDNWVERLNSILLESDKQDKLKDYYKLIIDCFSDINDVISLNDFELLLENNSLTDIKNFLSKIDKMCQDYGKKISCTIDMTNVNSKMNLHDLMSADYNNINFIFDFRISELRDNKEIFQRVIDAACKTKSMLYFKNQDLHSAPYIVGKAGPYTFNPQEWCIYTKNSRSISKGIVCGQASAAIDVYKFGVDNKSASQFKVMLMAVVRALLTANSMQRRKSVDFFSASANLNPNFLNYCRSYIRFWNYGWKQKDIDPEDRYSLIKNLEGEVQNFASSQETIYLSCGIPTRFKVSFSCEFRRENSKMSDPRFKKVL